MPSQQIMTTQLPLALTMGDPAGIGPDITLMAWAMRDKTAIPAFVVLGDTDVFTARAHQLGLEVPVIEIGTPEETRDCFALALPIYRMGLPQTVIAGVPDSTSSAKIVEAIETGFSWTREHRTAALVTNPINKKLLSDAGFSHPGHTEFLAELSAQAGKVPRPVMLLTSGDLRVVPVTVHLPLKAVPEALSEQLIVETVEIAARALRSSFDLSSPRIGITGLNPHAGEDGTMGDEEVKVITPAIKRLKASGIDVTGPISADAVFQERARSHYDVIIAMYHDQALIPVKTLAFDRTVNTTLGLPIVRTSPDHGTAYELAGTGKAHPGSLIEALRLADTLASRELATT